MKTTAKAHLLRSTLLAAITAAPGFALSAQAQDTVGPSAAAAAESDVVVVTGTRIARSNAEAESPLVTVTAEQMAESGFTTVEHYLNTLPQVTAGVSSQSNNPSSNGRAFIDLRGLGSGRNLVLIDGRRGMGSTGGGVVDVNTIPTALVENVEIVTGGAASTYGADAVAGVVNFILKKDFEGVEFDGQYRITEQDDGVEWGGGITMGGNFDGGRGNAVFNVNYFEREDMYKDARAFSAQASNTTTIFPDGSYATGSNTPTVAAINSVFPGGACAPTISGAVNRTGGSGGFGFNPDGSLFCTGVSGNAFDVVGYTGPESAIATQFYPDMFSYNFEPDNILVLPMERWSLYSRVSYDVNDHFKPYAQAMYTNYSALQELAPTPAGGTTGWNVATSNPFITSQLATLLASREAQTYCYTATGTPSCAGTGASANPLLVSTTNPALAGAQVPFSGAGAPLAFSKRFNALGGRTGYNTHDVWQVVTGSTGDLFAGWTYDVYASFGRSVQNEIQGGNVRRDRVGQLLGNIDAFVTPTRLPEEPLADYQARVRAATDAFNAQVAAFQAPTVAQQAALSGGACPNGLNLFGNAPIDPSCAAWISLEAKNLTVVEQSIVEATVSGDLFELPAGTVQAAFGAAYRELDFDFRPDGGLQPGLVAGFNQQLPVSGYLDYRDIFAEVLVPVVKDLPFVESFSLTAGIRQTDNNNTGADTSWKVNYDWTINDWVRSRGGFQTAVRAPTINELYAPQLNNFPTFTAADPCNTSGTTNQVYGRTGPNAAQVQALCATQSAVAGGASYQQPSGQANGITGGNPDLQPETSESFTVGLVFNSPFQDPLFSGFYGSVDYWSIEMEDVIAAVGATAIVQRCFNRDNANPTFDPNNSWCQLFSRDQSNGGVIELKQLSQNQAFLNTSGIDIVLGYGYDFGAAGQLDINWITTWVERYETQTTAVDPMYDFVGTIGSGTGSATPEWRSTLTTSYSWEDLSLQWTTRWIEGMKHANTVTGSSPLTNTSVPTTFYMDLTGQYKITDNITFRAGINNLLDQEPRLYTPNMQANTDPSTFDVLGRRFFVGLNVKM